MKHVKLLICLGCLFIINTAYGATWVRTNDGNNPMHIDIESIIQKGDWGYYNVKYYEPKVGEDIIVTVQANPTKAGIVHICRSSKVEQNPILCTTNDIEDTATKFTDLNEDSLLYEANIKAFEMMKAAEERKIAEANAPAPLKVASVEKYEREVIEEPPAPPPPPPPPPPVMKVEPPILDDGDLNTYVRMVESLIQRNWRPPRSAVSRQVVTVFTLNRDGSLVSSQILQTSDSERTDKSALEAIKKSVPFEPFPHSYKPNEMEIKFTFRYNVHRKGHENESF